MNKPMTLTLAAVLGIGATAAAASTVEDINGDGVYSMEELTVTYPSVTAEVYTAIDANGDGAVDDAELAAAVEAGVLVEG